MLDLRRAEWNVRDSDGTVVFSIEAVLKSGSKKTIELAGKKGKPWLHLPQKGYTGNPGIVLRGFVKRHHIQILNVAGPRASIEPGIGQFVTDTLESALACS